MTGGEIIGWLLFVTFLILGGWFFYKSRNTSSCSDYTDESNCTTNDCLWDGTNCNDKPSPDGGNDCSSKSSGDECDGEIAGGIYNCSGKPLTCKFTNQCKSIDGIQYEYDATTETCKKKGTACSPPAGASTIPNSHWENDPDSNVCVNVCDSGYTMYNKTCLKDGDSCTPPGSGDDTDRINYKFNNGDCVKVGCNAPYTTMSSSKDPYACDAIKFDLTYAGAGYKTMFHIFDNMGKSIHSTAHGEEGKKWTDEIIPEGGYLEGYCNDTPANAKGKRGYVTFGQLETVLKKSSGPITHNWCPNGRHKWGSTLTSDSYTRWDNGSRPVCSGGVCKFQKSNKSAGVRTSGDAPV